MGIQKSEIEKYLIIEENAIKTKKECVVELDTEELQVRDEGSHYLSPGFFTIKFIDGFEFLLPFTFKVNVHKSNDIDDETKIIKIKYNENATIISAEFIDKEVDLRQAAAILELRLPYINKYIYNLVLNSWEYFNRMGSFNILHIEMLLSQLFLDPKENIPIRLTSGDYSKAKASGLSKNTIERGSLQSIVFGNIKQTMMNAVLNEKDMPLTPVEKIIMNVPMREKREKVEFR